MASATQVSKIGISSGKTPGYIGAPSVGGLRHLRAGTVLWEEEVLFTNAAEFIIFIYMGTRHPVGVRGAQWGDKGDKVRMVDSGGHKRRRQWRATSSMWPARGRGSSTLPAGRRRLLHHRRRRMQRCGEHGELYLVYCVGIRFIPRVAGGRPLWIITRSQALVTRILFCVCVCMLRRGRGAARPCQRARRADFGERSRRWRRRGRRTRTQWQAPRLGRPKCC